MDKSAVLLLAHGTPDSVSEIPEYLRNVTGGRAIPDSVIEEVKHRYGLIGQSPLTRITLRQGELLSKSLKTPVYVGMRNWKPYIADVVSEMRADGVTSAVALCLAPQNSRTSVGLYRKALEGAAQNIAIHFIESWHDHPLLITAFAEKLEAARAKFGRDIPVIFTAHSVPARTISDGDPYEQQARETGALVAQRIGLPPKQWTFAFQSQGMSGGPWIGPTVEETITKFKHAGHARVLIQPVGFVCDHVEVLYDIDIAFREFGSRVGVEVVRAESLNDSPAFIMALTDLVKTRGRANPTVTRTEAEITKNAF
ncbi:MAG TPA: ferrochelatase [Terriglobales bacterium]|nr:ferrochelatase [Terriglobales bacterium]